MKIEKGKFYKTRQGLKVEIVWDNLDNDSYPILGIIDNGVQSTYTADGHIICSDEESANDLIEEWTNEPKQVPLTWKDIKCGDIITCRRRDGRKSLLVIVVDQDYIITGDMELDYKQLMESWEFADGRPCSKGSV